MFPKTPYPNPVRSQEGTWLLNFIEPEVFNIDLMIYIFPPNEVSNLYIIHE